MSLQDHTCAIVGSSGELKCWGWNDFGQVQGRFLEGRGGVVVTGGAMLGERVCDVVVTPCDLRSLEMARPRMGSLMLLCLG